MSPLSTVSKSLFPLLSLSVRRNRHICFNAYTKLHKQNRTLFNVSYCLVSPFLSSYKVQRWASLLVCFGVEGNLELQSSLTNGSVLMLAHVVHPGFHSVACLGTCRSGTSLNRHLWPRGNLEEVIFHSPGVCMELLTVEEE